MESSFFVQNCRLNLSGDWPTIFTMTRYDLSSRPERVQTHEADARSKPSGAKRIGGRARSPFISTGLQSVDDGMRGGFAREHMTMVAGRAQVGATSLLLGAVLHALEQGLKVAWYSDRLNARQLTGRLILRASEVNGYRIQAGLMTDEEQFALDKARESIGWERLLIHARREVALKDVLNQCIQDPPDLLVIDFRPQKSSASGKSSYRAYEQGLKALAQRMQKCGAAAVVREVLPRGNHAPDRIELPGLGSVVEHFESAVMIHRHTGENEADDVDSSRAFAQIIRVQHRDIKTRSVPLRFDQRFAGLFDREV